MASDWRYLLTQFNGDGSETIIDSELLIEGASVARVLSGPGQLTGTISHDLDRLILPNGLPKFQRWGSGIYAENEHGEIRGGGILVDYTIGPDGALSLDVVGPTGYAKDLPYTDSRYWIEADPLGIYREAWAHIQSQPYGNIGLTFDQTASPVRVGKQIEDVSFTTGAGQQVAFEAGPYKLNWYTTDDLGGEFDKLANETPFDYLEQHWWEGETLRHHVRLGYPSIGGRRENLRFVLGENVFQVPSRAYSGEGVANEVQVLGVGEGRDKKRGYQRRAPEGHLRRVLQVDDNTIKTEASAQSRAARELAGITMLPAITELVVREHANAPIGSFDVGDEIFYAGRSAWGDVELWVTITKLIEAPGDGSQVRLTVQRSDTIMR